MKIDKIHVEGFKSLKCFDLELNEQLTVIVGDNETGKSSVLEALNLVLTRTHEGRLIDYNIDPYLFNSEIVSDFFQKMRSGENSCSPEILIEAYLLDDPANSDIGKLKGSNNSKNEDAPGLKLEIKLDNDYLDLFKEYVRDDQNPPILPVEYFKSHWKTFTDNNVSTRNPPLKSKIIDTSLPRTARGSNRYIGQMVEDALSLDQQRGLSLAYKKLRHDFSNTPGVQEINKHLEEKGSRASTKNITVQMDVSTKSKWENAIAPHLNDLPFDCAGKGEHCRILLRLAIADSTNIEALLIEEPENHLSHSNLNALMNDISNDCQNQQVVVTTHSGFVLNKLGIDNLRLISRENRSFVLNDLETSTKNYFMKLPGYNTLRLFLATKCVLVEGPSDELIVQRAYELEYDKLPIEDGVDVISVGSLAFKRFLELAIPLELNVAVVTDNDRNVEALKEKYKDYLDEQKSSINIYYDNDEECPSLEEQMLKANSLQTINDILEKGYKDKEGLLAYMKRNKTDCALKFFETSQTWSIPDYIKNAIRK